MVAYTQGLNFPTSAQMGDLPNTWFSVHPTPMVHPSIVGVLGWTRWPFGNRRACHSGRLGASASCSLLKRDSNLQGPFDSCDNDATWTEREAGLQVNIYALTTCVSTYPTWQIHVRWKSRLHDIMIAVFFEKQATREHLNEQVLLQAL